MFPDCEVLLIFSLKLLVITQEVLFAFVEFFFYIFFRGRRKGVMRVTQCDIKSIFVSNKKYFFLLESIPLANSKYFRADVTSLFSKFALCRILTSTVPRRVQSVLSVSLELLH